MKFSILHLLVATALAGAWIAAGLFFYSTMTPADRLSHQIGNVFFSIVLPLACAGIAVGVVALFCIATHAIVMFIRGIDADRPQPKE